MTSAQLSLVRAAKVDPENSTLFTHHLRDNRMSYRSVAILRGEKLQV